MRRIATSDSMSRAAEPTSLLALVAALRGAALDVREGAARPGKTARSSRRARSTPRDRGRSQRVISRTFALQTSSVRLRPRRRRLRLGSLRLLLRTVDRGPHSSFPDKSIVVDGERAVVCAVEPCSPGARRRRVRARTRRVRARRRRVRARGRRVRARRRRVRRGIGRSQFGVFALRGRRRRVRARRGRLRRGSFTLRRCRRRLQTVSRTLRRRTRSVRGRRRRLRGRSRTLQRH